ncbi:MAG: carboxymuconolactone decarboxylase family protein [Planctomycetes bacterium]|nr:carboxymuconolactone decarboxylase family protein [Planctomycetota bacterium]
MDNTKSLIDALPEAAKDLKLNLQSVLGDGTLSREQRFGVALACAFASRNEALRDALAQDVRDALGDASQDAWFEDAQAAAALMAMNNVYYRFRHMIGKPSYGTLPAKLRMGRIANPKTSKLDFELMCLAVSAINACEMCVRSHEHSLLELGASEAQVHDAVRIAAVVNGVAVSLELQGAPAGDI